MAEKSFNQIKRCLRRNLRQHKKALVIVGVAALVGLVFYQVVSTEDATKDSKKNEKDRNGNENGDINDGEESTKQGDKNGKKMKRGDETSSDFDSTPASSSQRGPHSKAKSTVKPRVTFAAEQITCTDQYLPYYDEKGSALLEESSLNIPSVTTSLQSPSSLGNLNNQIDESVDFSYATSTNDSVENGSQTSEWMEANLDPNDLTFSDSDRSHFSSIPDYISESFDNSSEALESSFFQKIPSVEYTSPDSRSSSRADHHTLTPLLEPFNILFYSSDEGKIHIIRQLLGKNPPRPVFVDVAGDISSSSRKLPSKPACHIDSDIGSISMLVGSAPKLILLKSPFVQKSSLANTPLHQTLESSENVPTEVVDDIFLSSLF
ncbi:hypothetical protein AX774_g4373 [Zancudomyces culisetae]|uniref:Uncharacterized protein n=1 Tax=Zancudomyces culisetae TaxID=1213189 RepID=A0A1R1PMF8_ZANCU|nr:hypothetical protein AX774_g4373 [Zancudomyces culisetae]|eukprot:OMH82151.1 hypothetical protein AX774_g4373 [Zancudomyces culisetae]